MIQYYVPKSGNIKLSNGKSFKVSKGVQLVPDELANSHEANKYGIKPTSEMTDDEWRLIGMKKTVQ